ncbi:MAG: gamma carbonic anhydrase family protein [Candidatus Omnitrophica bacterium]|nr:gamma carbonic anhydrase family protein [Candidatus Omnitrophota bacterium]
MASKKAYTPKIGKNVFIDPSAQVIGQVTLGDYSSIWPGCVVRGDINRIRIGKYSNIQDLSLIHVESDRGCRIGNYVTVGHQVTLHACTVKDQSLIGIGSILLDGAHVGEGVILGAGSLVTMGQRLKSGCLYFGRPAKWVRNLTVKEIKGLKKWAERYVHYAADHKAGKYQRIE